MSFYSTQKVAGKFPAIQIALIFMIETCGLLQTGTCFHEIQKSCHPFEFVCPGEKCIPYTSVCDGVQDCTQNADEICKLNHSRESNIEEMYMMYTCVSGEQIPSKYVNDLIPDCYDGDDEELYHNKTKQRLVYDIKCQSEDMLPCEWGTGVCFYRHELCMYDRDKEGILTICRNGAHLEHCEHIDCSNRFKCPEMFCIPHRRVCDSIVDCSYGEDEQRCDNYMCPGMYRKCKH